MNGKLIELPTSKLLSKFGAGSHKPGSGSAVALQGILSAHLLRTVISLTKDPKRSERYAKQLPDLLKIECELDNRLLPNLERLFQEDSDQFETVIQLRQGRENQIDPLAQKQLADQAISALIPATEMPLQIAKDCLEIARFALKVFDFGFHSARGDSGVAINAALSAVSGCLSIIQLNLLSFGADEWTERIRTSCDALLAELNDLTKMAQDRLSEQISQSERKALFSREIQKISNAAKGKKSLSEVDIENLAILLQRTLWINKDLLGKAHLNNPFDLLDPDIAFKCIGFYLERPATLGQYMSRGMQIEVAGQIDQQTRLVSISQQFPIETQRFTAAHELGHSLIHTQQVLHRDRPLDGAGLHVHRDDDEWQADKFATYFLMPKKLFKKTFSNIFLTEKFQITEETAFALNEGTSKALREKCRDLRGLSRLLAKATLYNGVHIYSLSKQFRVSTEAIAIRLEELDLVDF